MNTADRKNVCSKSTIETPEQKFRMMALEYIKVSQLLLGVCKLQIKYLYISYFF